MRTKSRQLAAEAFQLFYAERHKVSFFDDALDVLERFSQRHTLGALTNGNADIARLGLDRFFRFAFSAADVGAPNPRRRCSAQLCCTADVARTSDDPRWRQPDRRRSGRRGSRHSDDLGQLRWAQSGGAAGDPYRASTEGHSDRDRRRSKARKAQTTQRACAATNARTSSTRAGNTVRRVCAPLSRSSRGCRANGFPIAAIDRLRELCRMSGGETHHRPFDARSAATQQCLPLCADPTM